MIKHLKPRIGPEIDAYIKREKRKTLKITKHRNQFIKKLKKVGIWDKIDYFYINGINILP